MPMVNKAFAILAALAFLLPFATISCNGTKLVEMSGAKLAQCSVSNCSPDDFMSPNLKTMTERYAPRTNLRPRGQQGKVDFAWSNMIQTKNEPNGANYVLFAAIGCLIAVAALFLQVRIEGILSGAGSVAAIVFLVLFRIKFGDVVATHLHTSETNVATAFMKFDLQFSSGFWASLILSAASAILAFKGAFGAQRAAPLRANIANNQPTTICPACRSVNPGGNKFCLSCGGSLVSPPAPNSPAKPPGATCPSCGAGNVPENKFCLSCGKPLATSASSMQPALATASASQTETKAAAAAAVPVAQSLPFTAFAASELPPKEPATANLVPEPPATTQLSAAEEPKLQPVCSACGVAFAPTQKFCLACGAPVGATADGSAATAEATPTRENALFTPAASSDQYQAGPFQTSPRSNNAIWLIMVVLAAVVGGAGWLIWRYFSGPDVTVTTIPQRIHVATGGRTTLQASVSGSKDTDITWSIQEGDKGGRLIPMGAVIEDGRARATTTYTAPQTDGTFHVIATSHANPNRTAKVEIVVGSSTGPETATSPTPETVLSSNASATLATNPYALPVLGTWRWPSDDRKMTIAPDSTITVTSDADPQKNMHGTYRFTDKSHLQVDFGNGDVRTWEILGEDKNYLRVLSQSQKESSPTAMVFARIN